MDEIKVGSDFTGVGSFDQALKRLKIKYKTVFACDMDKYARITYIANNGVPKYYPKNVYDRIIPKEPLDIYMTSPPCQSFSFAGKRKGEDDPKGVLFYNSHEFILKNKPRYFIFENVKGLLSDNKCKTFGKWIEYLGGKSVNGNPVMFPLNNSTPYHIYTKVLNAKHYGVPQNRERIFIIGIRDDVDNNFTWPKAFPLVKKLKDVLEENVDDKYYLSDSAINRLCYNTSGFKSTPKNGNEIASTICTSDYKISRGMNVLKVKSATKKGHEIAQTLDTSCKQGVMIAHVSRNEEGKRLRKKYKLKGKDFTPFKAKKTTFKEADVMNCITTAIAKDNLIKIGAIRGRGENNKQQLEINQNGISNSLTTVQKDNLVIENYTQYDASGKGYNSQQDRVYNKNGVMCNLSTSCGGKTLTKINNKSIRRLTPRECFRLMGYKDSFKLPCSDTQLYKQAGNSIVVDLLELIINKMLRL